MEFQACMREGEDEDALTHLPPRPLLRGSPASAPPPSVTSGRPGLGRKLEECGPAWWMASVAKQRGWWPPTLGLALGPSVPASRTEMRDGSQKARGEAGLRVGVPCVRVQSLLAIRPRDLKKDLLVALFSFHGY